VHTVAETHALDYRRRDPFSVRHRFVGRHIVGQIEFVHTSEAPQKGPQTRARSLTTVAMHLAYAIAVVISRPFISAMAYAGVALVHTSIIRALHHGGGTR
jgi:hypothetical protein